MEPTTVPPDYRNVICPWQTPREIRAQSKFLDRMFRKLDPFERRELLRLDSSDRVWLPRPGRWMRALHKTHWGNYEVRTRADGAYDVRDIVKGGGEPPQRAPAAYVRAEFVIYPGPRRKRC